MTELQDPKPAADRVRFAENLVESLIGTVAETVPSGGDVALLGGEALAWRWGRELSAPPRAPLRRSRRSRRGVARGQKRGGARPAARRRRNRCHSGLCRHGGYRCGCYRSRGRGGGHRGDRSRGRGALWARTLLWPVGSYV